MVGNSDSSLGAVGSTWALRRLHVPMESRLLRRLKAKLMKRREDREKGEIHAGAFSTLAGYVHAKLNQF